tara:strand:- start:737 stop:1003 length:267 start_codon:yes stop_codon:yes gene_type:complete
VNKNTLYIIGGIIALLLIYSSFKTPIININGYTQKEVDYLLEINNLKNKTKLLKYDIEIFKESIIKDSAFVHNASNQQIDSLFTNYFR